MEKCHSCGTTRENSAKTFRELDEACYCIFCLDADGKPRKQNPVRKSVKSFWRERATEDTETVEYSN